MILNSASFQMTFCLCFSVPNLPSNPLFFSSWPTVNFLWRRKRKKSQAEKFSREGKTKDHWPHFQPRKKTWKVSLGRRKSFFGEDIFSSSRSWPLARNFSSADRPAAVARPIGKEDVWRRCSRKLETDERGFFSEGGRDSLNSLPFSLFRCKNALVESRLYSLDEMLECQKKILPTKSWNAGL